MKHFRKDKSKIIDPKGRRILGLTEDGRAVFEPNDQASSLVFAATGGGKTTKVALPAIMCALSDPNRAVVYNDAKRGEISHQVAEMCEKHGRKFGVIDDTYVMGADYPYRLNINPVSPIDLAYQRGDPNLPFYVESFMYTLIPEPKGGSGGQDRNFYWREMPRNMGDTALRGILDIPDMRTPGALAAVLNNPETYERVIYALAQREGPGPLPGRARQILRMRDRNPDLYSQHLTAIQTALKVFSEGPLSTSGSGADITHEQALAEKYVIGVISPTEHLDRLAVQIAQHFNSFADAQIAGKVGKTDFIIDEFCAGPFEPALKKITIFRAFKARLVLIAQSRKDSIRRYGEEFTSVLEENCLIKQFLKVSQFEEAERLSKAMGDELTLQKGLNADNQHATRLGTSLGLGRQRQMSATDLMSMPSHLQIGQIAGFGFAQFPTISQNQIAPYCFDLAPNPLEGGRLTPDPKITLKTLSGD